MSSPSGLPSSPRYDETTTTDDDNGQDFGEEETILLGTYEEHDKLTGVSFATNRLLRART